MNRLLRYTLIFLLPFALTFCSDSSTGPDSDDGTIQPQEGLVGGWSATSVEYVMEADENVRADVSQYVSVSVVVEQDSSYSFVTTAFGQPLTDTGVITTAGNTVSFTSSLGDHKSGTFQILGLNLDLVIFDRAFDFDQNGTDEPASLHVALTKTN